MGYGAQQQHEPIGRTIQLAAPMRVEDVALTPHPEYGMPMFNCRPLRSTLSVQSCAANYERRLTSCAQCPVGKAHNIGAKAKPVRPEPGVAINTPMQSCIRCGRDGGVTDSHSDRIMGRFRTVSKTSKFLKGGTPVTTLCMNCFNRGQECRPDVMRNSKGAIPKLHSAFLRDTAITYAANGKTYADVNVGLRSSVLEVRRLLSRAYDEDAKLIEVRFNGEVANLESTDDPAWVADKPGKQKTKTPTRKRTRTAKPIAKPIASVAQFPAWADVFGEQQPREETLRDYGFGSDLAEFVAWLTKDWPVLALNAAERSADVPATVASVEVIEAVSEPSGAAADALNSIEPIAEDEQDESEWAGCSADGVLVTDYASEHGISDEAAAIELGLCDPHYEDEPGPAPIAQLAFERKGAAPKERTGKALRKQQKREAREARIAEQAARGIPATKPAAAAIAARGLVLCMQYAAQIQKVGA